MNKRGWIIPILIIAINAILIILRWSSFPELLPAHFDLQGNADGVMPRSNLLMYPVISAARCLIAYLIAWKKCKLQTGMIVLASGISIILLLSTLVTLTSGKMPVFMLAEPVILLATVVAFVVCVLKARK